MVSSPPWPSVRSVPPLVDGTEVGLIVAFAFGNRIAADGSVEPGLINRLLAVAVAHAHALTSAGVVAQWEIGRVLYEQGLVAAESVTIVEPTRRPDGTEEYLNTAGVARAAASALSGAAQAADTGLPVAKRAVAVVAHADHAARCVAELQRLSIRAGVLAESTLPTAYDPRSGQPWTRTRTRYLAHDGRVRNVDT